MWGGKGRRGQRNALWVPSGVPACSSEQHYERSAGVQACPLPAMLLLAEQQAEHMRVCGQRQSPSLSHLHVTSAGRKL